MTDNFYRAFEERFRGSREVIQERLRVYIPFIEPLLPYLKTGRAIDIGCGRGEWLELMMELGLEAVGVDLDDGMLAACRERNLVVHTQDALEYLKGLPDESQVVVSGFHLVEHVSFSFLRNLVLEAKRVLEPGGLLIFETPNPENLVVGATTFYLDPTHNHPIPPVLLQFVCEYSGFERTKIVRLQEDVNIVKRQETTILDVLSGVSPDYAIVAQKKCHQDLLKANNAAFSAKYGVTLKELANKYHYKRKNALLNTWLLLKKSRFISQLNNSIKKRAFEIKSIISHNSTRVTSGTHDPEQPCQSDSYKSNAMPVEKIGTQINNYNANTVKVFLELKNLLNS